jgi:serine/threonine-protein kinase
MASAVELEDEDTLARPNSSSKLRLEDEDELPRFDHFPGRVEPGTLLGNYLIMMCLARGGMASVWVARHRSARGLSKLVALKTILPELAAEPSFEQMFLQEARLASLIHHPNVCETFELIEIDGVLALSMEWVDGASLARMLSACGKPLNARVAARIAAQAAAGLHAAHELRDEAGRPMNLVHRDVSPQNILLSRDGHVRLSDFGIAKAMSGTRELSSIVHVQGKAAYLSPEQARNEPLDRRSDVFSLGTVLYLAALGHRPFSLPGGTPEQALARLLGGEFLHPLKIDPRFPLGLAAIILRAMRAEPSQRYQTAAEMRHDLEAWLARSGSFLAEQAVAQTLEERCGASLERQQARLRAAMSRETQDWPPASERAGAARPDEIPRSGTFRSAPNAAVPPPASARGTQPEERRWLAPASPSQRAVPEVRGSRSKARERPWSSKPFVALAWLIGVVGIGAASWLISLALSPKAPAARDASSLPAKFSKLPPASGDAWGSKRTLAPDTSAPFGEVGGVVPPPVPVEALPTATPQPRLVPFSAGNGLKTGNDHKNLGPVERDL